MGNYFAYMRISTQEERAKQKFTRQEHALRNYLKDNNIELTVDPFRDDCSGKSFDRPNWQKLNKIVHDGDTIIFKDVSRFTRECDHGLEVYMDLLDRNVDLIFIDNAPISTPYIKQIISASVAQQNRIVRETLAYVVKLLLTVELDRVEQERLTLIQRTKDGMAATTKKLGRPVGHLDKMTDALKEDIVRYLTERAVKVKPICDKHNISFNTFKKYAQIVADEMKK